MSEHSRVPVTGVRAGQTRQLGREYNHERTHSSLNNMTPAEFIRSLQKDEDL